MIPYTIIGSGSQGNATIIFEHYMIDCGVTKKSLKPYIDNLSVVFLTHRHGDHFRKSTIKALAEARPTLRFACCDWLVQDLVILGVPYRNIDVLKPEYIHAYTHASVIPFKLTHDVPNCGYKFITPDGSLFYATDCANLNGIEAEDYTLYMIEANHKSAEIARKIADKKASGEYAYEIRAQEMHLSEEAANEWLLKNMGPDSSYIYMHVHEDRKEMINAN